MTGYIGSIKIVHTQGRRARETTEKNIVAHVQVYRPDLSHTRHPFTILQYAARDMRQDLYTRPAVMKRKHGDDMPTNTPRGGSIMPDGCRTVGNRDVPAVFLVYVAHHLPEQPTVNRCVFKPVYTYMIMYHLMNDDVFEFSFGKVETSTYAKHKIIANDFTEHGPALLERAGTEKSPCLAQADRKPWQPTIKDKPVELIELTLYIRYCRYHVDFAIEPCR